MNCMTGSYLGVHRTVVTFVTLIRFLSLLPTEVAVNNEDDLYLQCREEKLTGQPMAE